MDFKEHVLEDRERMWVIGASIIIALLVIIFLYFILNAVSKEAMFAVLGIKAEYIQSGWQYSHPFTIQNFMWIMFGICGGELYLRYRFIKEEAEQLNKHYLPEDDSILESRDLPKIVRSVKSFPKHGNYFLPRFIIRICEQFQLAESSDEAHAMLCSNMEVFDHEIDLRYTFIRYVIWFIPTLGFIGTIYGVALALGLAGKLPTDPGYINPADPRFLPEITSQLGIAFYTTLLALVQSVGLVWVQNWFQFKEEKLLNYSMQYCIDNLINRLYKRN